MSEPYQHDGLMCRISRIEIDYTRNEAWLHFPEGECCDMNGCIAFVLAACPGAERIFTKSGPMPDTAYVKADGEWKAMKYIDGHYVMFD